MAMGMPYGLQAMLKEGHKHFSGVEEAVLKNIDACKALSQMTRTSLGPNGVQRRMARAAAAGGAAASGGSSSTAHAAHILMRAPACCARLLARRQA